MHLDGATQTIRPNHFAENDDVGRHNYASLRATTDIDRVSQLPETLKRQPLLPLFPIA